MQQPIYLPSYDQNTWQPIPGQDVAMMILLPDAWRKGDGKKWGCQIFCHGMGQRGPGTIAALNNVFTGQMQAIPDDWKQAVDKYGIVSVLVNYNEFFQPASWKFVDNYMMKNYGITTKFMRQGFSWGAGSVIKAMQDTEIAGRTAVAIGVSGTIESGVDNVTGWTNTAKSGAVIWGHTNRIDNTVGAEPTERWVTRINSYTPVIPATLTEYDASGHGPTNIALGLAPPQAPGKDAKGLTNASENVYELYLRCLAGNASVPKSGTVIPVPPVEPPATVKAVTSYQIAGNTIALKGSDSTGYKTGLDGAWAFKSGPEGVTSKQVFPTGSTYINANGVLPAVGTYVFRFTLAGTPAPTDVTVVYGSATTKIPVSYDGTKLWYKDGSSEVATLIWDLGTLTAKTGTGVIYNL